jgi:hypothetical protein
MVLRLKAWESRSPPNLINTKSSLIDTKPKTPNNGRPKKGGRRRWETVDNYDELRLRVATSACI